MSSWFADKVGQMVRDAPQLGPSRPRTADELASELEGQARRVTGPAVAVDLVSKWVERSDAGQGTFPLGGGEALSFYQALLRSRALEALLEACGRTPALRAALLRGGGCSETEAAPLIQGMRLVADRLLLPGALALWPTLLEVLVAAGGAEDVDKGKMISCGPWARRALALVKRRWQSEALPVVLRRLDKEVTDLASRQNSAKEGEATTGTAELLRPGSSKKLSKTGIRAALARDRLQHAVADASRLRARTELLSEMCAKLEVAVGASVTSVPEVERLLADADEMLAALDAGVKELNAEQEELNKSLTEVARALEKQIATSQDTLSSFSEKRTQLQEERASLSRRLEEVNMHLLQLDRASSACAAEAKQLQTQLRDTTFHYETKIADSFCRQKHLADEKLRAVACKECAHVALDVVRGEEQRQAEELGVQLRRRRAELRRVAALYLHQERLRLDASVDYARMTTPKSSRSSKNILAPTHPRRFAVERAPTGGASDEITQTDRALNAALDCWQAAQAILRRVQPLVRETFPAATPAVAEAALDESIAAPGGGADGGAVADEGGGGEGGGGSDGCGQPSDDAASAGCNVSTNDVALPAVAQPPPVIEDAPSFFASLAARERVCIDCGSDADWATVSFGSYLCVDCAGRHRGLGVHISFVRSTTMDLWSPEQLRRMQVGGTPRFSEFLQQYPRLRDYPWSPTALAARYGSRAAAYYRALLDARCEGNDSPDMECPSADVGHLLAEAQGQSAGAGSGVSPSGAESGRRDDGEEPEDGELSLEEEIAAFEASYLAHRQKLLAGPTATEPSASPSSPEAAVGAVNSIGSGVAVEEEEEEDAFEPEATSLESPVGLQGPAADPPLFPGGAGL